MIKRVTSGLAAAVLAASLWGCDNPNKTNDTGEEIQEAVEKTGDAVERGAAKAARAVENGAREVGQELEEGAAEVEGEVNDPDDVKEQRREVDRAAGSVDEVPEPKPEPRK